MIEKGDQDNRKYRQDFLRELDKTGLLGDVEAEGERKMG